MPLDANVRAIVGRTERTKRETSALKSEESEGLDREEEEIASDTQRWRGKIVTP